MKVLIKLYKIKKWKLFNLKRKYNFLKIFIYKYVGKMNEDKISFKEI